MQRDQKRQDEQAATIRRKSGRYGLEEFVWSSRVLLVSAIAAQSLAGVLIIAVGLFLFVRPWSQSLYRRLSCKWCGTAWVEAMSLVLPQLRMTINGDSDMLDGIGSGVIIVNHQTEIDWWAIFMVARFVGLHGNIKVICKEGLKRFPLLGWFLQLLEFPFLGRSWVDYRAQLMSQFRSFAHEDFPTLYLIFPEGAQKDLTSLRKSREFAAREGRPELRHLLLPHTTGFNACLDALRESFPVVYDVTLAYQHCRNNPTPVVPRGIWSGLSHFVSADVPHEVHVHIKRFSVEEVVGDAHWLDARWHVKDQLLQNFSESGSLSGSPLPSPGRNGPAVSSASFPGAPNGVPQPAHAFRDPSNGAAAAASVQWHHSAVHSNGYPNGGMPNMNGHGNGSSCGTNGQGFSGTQGIRRGDSRAYNKEAAVLSMARLCLLPFVLPVIIVFSLPLTVTCITGYILHTIFSYLRRQSSLLGDRGGSNQSPAPSRGRSPWVPRTPFTSPLARVFEREAGRNGDGEDEIKAERPTRRKWGGRTVNTG